MKIPKRYYPLLIVLLISAAMIAWGSLNLSVTNTATVTVAKNLALDIIPSTSSCPAYLSGAYSLTNATIALIWPTISEPGGASFLFCLENVGTATQVTFTQETVTPSPAPGSLTLAPVGSVSITAVGVTPITETLTATFGTPAQTYSFSLAIN